LVSNNSSSTDVCRIARSSLYERATVAVPSRRPEALRPPSPEESVELLRFLERATPAETNRSTDAASTGPALPPDTPAGEAAPPLQRVPKTARLDRIATNSAPSDR
jgi:hypothetical protein